MSKEEQIKILQATAIAIYEESESPTRKRQLAIRVHDRLSGTDALLDQREGEGKIITAETVERKIRMPPRRHRRPK